MNDASKKALSDRIIAAQKGTTEAPQNRVTVRLNDIEFGQLDAIASCMRMSRTACAELLLEQILPEAFEITKKTLQNLPTS